MENPILERLKSVIAAMNSNPTDFSKKIGISQTTFSNQLRSPRGVSVEAITLTLEHFPEISAEWLMRGKGDMLLANNLPDFHGEETDSELNVHATLARMAAELEEYKMQNLRLQAQKDYLQDRNDDLVITNRMLQDELNKYQEPRKKDIV